MRRFKCLVVSSPSFSASRSLVLEAESLAEKVITNQTLARFDSEQLVAWLAENHADAAIIGTEPLTRDMIERLPHLRAVGKYGVGLDNIDGVALKDKGVFLGWSGGVNKRSVSELVLSFMLGHFRNVFRSVDRMQNGSWVKDGGVQLSNRTVGIVGLGHIGFDVAKLLKAFGASVQFFDILDKRAEAAKLGVHAVEYRKLIETSDVVTLHVPGGEDTKNLYGAREIGFAKQDQLVVNTARASVVDFEAVVQAVQAKRLGGFASDVFLREPYSQTDLSVDRGFYFTPHIGGNAAEAVEAMGKSAISSLRQFLST